MTTLILDGTQLFIRCHAAYPTTNTHGQHIGGVYGFLSTLQWMVHDIQPSRVVIVFDGPGGSKRRRAINPEYKQGRKPKQYNRVIELDSKDEFKSKLFQFQRLEHYLSHLPVTVVSIDDIEADDTIAFICNWLSGDKVIASKDKDFLQLVSDNIKLYDFKKRKYITAEDCKSEYQVSPKNMALARAIAGDRSDNLKGVQGIGLKRLTKIIPEFNEPFLSQDELFNLAEKRGLKKITDNKELIQQNHRLMSLSSVMMSARSMSKIKCDLERTSQYQKTNLMLQLMRDGIDVHPSFFQVFLKLSYAVKNQ